MGYRYQHDLVQTYSSIRAAISECKDLRTDSYVAWGIKQDLLQLKWFLEDGLRACPEFSLEEDWLKEQEQIKIINYLKNDIQ